MYDFVKSVWICIQKFKIFISCGNTHLRMMVNIYPFHVLCYRFHNPPTTLSLLNNIYFEVYTSNNIFFEAYTSN